jgi:hypothetical protein
MDRRSQKDLLLKIDGLGKTVEYEDKNGDLVLFYEKNLDCNANLMDIIRYLRADDREFRTCMQQLSQWSLMGKHLVPLLVQYWCRDKLIDWNLCLMIVKCMVLLTMPVMPGSRDVPQQILALQKCKHEILLDKNLFVVMMNLAAECLSKGQRTKEDIDFLELLLTLFRNILHIPDPPPSHSSSEAHKHRLQETLIETFEEENVFEFFVVVAQQVTEPDFRRLAIVLLEILYLTFRSVTPEDLIQTFNDTQQRNTSVSSTTSLLKKVVSEENMIREARTVIVFGARHGRFGGVFMLPKKDGSLVIRHTTPSELVSSELTSPLPKVTESLRRGRHKLISAMETNAFVSTKTKLILKNFADKVLAHCYNDLMEVMKQFISGESSKKLYESDVDNFHWAIAFFTSYTGIIQTQKEQTFKDKLNASAAESANVVSKETTQSEGPSFDISSITSTLNKLTIVSIFQQIESLYEQKQWARLTLAVKAAKETLKIVFAMTTCSDDEMKQFALGLAHQLIYDRDLCLERLNLLLRKYKLTKQPKAYVLLRCHLSKGGRRM